MGITNSARTPRKLIISIVIALSLMAALTAAASAASNNAKWSGVGLVTFAGPSQDPAAPTFTEAEYKLKRNGSVRSVKITTSNELVTGILGDGAGGSAITKCKARKRSTACETLDTELTGARVTSFHKSEATLRGVTQEVMPVPGIGDLEVLSGKLRGKIEGIFSIDNATGAAVGTASLRIRKGSVGTYACFSLTPAGAVPLASLETCINNTGGMLFPIFLDVHDKGKFELGQGSGSMSDILALKGKVEVNALSNPFMGQFGGNIVISNGKASFPALEKPDRKNDKDDD